MKTLVLSEDKGVLRVSLNRPDLRNAFSPDMILELTEVFSKSGARADLRAVHLDGQGRIFCAGADLNYMQEMVNYSFEKNRSDAEVLHGMFEAVFSCPVPVVTRVHGAAFGGALGLIAASDIVIAEEKTQFCFSEVKLGLAPAVISDFVLRKCPLGQVAPWMISGQVFSAAEALRAGLVHQAAPSAGIPELVEKCLQGLRECGPESLRETKKLIQKVPALSRDEARRETAKVIAERRASAEGQEGLQSFLAKRPASWRLS